MVQELALPTPLDEPLANTPLKLVLAQVRHDRAPQVSEPNTLLAVQRALDEWFVEAMPFEQQDFNFTAGPGGATATNADRHVGWQLKSSDGSWIVTLQPDFFSIETRDYTGWATFIERFRALSGVVSETYAPKVEHRLGLRFVDEISSADRRSASDWSGRIRPEVLGLLNDKDFGQSVRASQQVVELQGPNDTRVIFRHGFEPASGQRSGSTYRLDHDCFRQRTLPFDTDSLMGALESLHTLALQVFQKAITPELYAELKGDEVHAS
nr:TIGR04255 family protein [Demequina sp. TTPB684]